MMDNFHEKFSPYAPFCLRIGLALVFLLFGAQKFYGASQATAEIDLILNIGFGHSSVLNFILAVAEILIGASLLVGWQVKWSAPLAAFLVLLFFGSLAAKYGISADPTLSRDMGLVGAALALWFLGAGKWSMDSRKLKVQNEK